MQGYGLNSYQRSSVTNTLRWLEKALAAIEEVLAADQQGTLYRMVTRLSPEQRRLTHELVDSLRREIAAVVAKFALRAEEEDGRQFIVAQLASAWEGLEEAKSTKLVRYGLVDSSLKESLDPCIDRFIELVVALEHVVASASEDGGP